MNDKKITLLVLDITLRGGIERVVSNLCQMFEMRGYSIRVISLHKSYDSPLYNFPDSIRIEYSTMIPFRGMFYKFSSIYAILKVILFSNLRRSDEIIISTHPLTTILISFFNKKLLSRVIASEHSTYMSHGKFVRALRRQAYKHVKGITTQTIDGVQHFKRDGLKAVKIANSVTETLDGCQWKLPEFDSNKVFTCLSLARFETVKQLHHLIEVAHDIRGSGRKIKINIVGSGPLGTFLKNLIIKSSLDEIIELHPPTNTIGKFYSEADAYLITSASEAFPMTMLEALSYSIPVVSYDQLVGPKEVIKNNINGLLCAQNSPKALSAALIGLIDDLDLQYRLRNGALNTALEYKSSSIAKSWDSLILK